MSLFFICIRPIPYLHLLMHSRLVTSVLLIFLDSCCSKFHNVSNWIFYWQVLFSFSKYPSCQVNLKLRTGQNGIKLPILES